MSLGFGEHLRWNQPYSHHPLGHGEPGGPQSANGRVSSSQQNTTRGNSGQYFDADRSAAEKVTTPYSDNQTSDTLPQNQVEDWKNDQVITLLAMGSWYNTGGSNHALKLLDANAQDEYANAIKAGTAIGMGIAGIAGKGRGVGAKYVTKGTFPTKLHRRNVENVAQLRKEFESIKPEFVRSYANSAEAAKRFTPQQIAKMTKSGKIPKGFVVHHKTPLFRGGDNSFDNFRVMNSKFHQRYNKRLHWYDDVKNI
jgi:hypothetical protein